MSSENDATSDFSIFGHKLDMPSISSDIARWDKTWEKILRTLSSSKDVYPILSDMWRGDNPEVSTMSQGLYERVCSFQEALVNIWDDMENMGSHFVQAWMLLEEEERRRHLLNGLKKTCERASCGQDTRALCPEITTSAMLKQRGVAFLDFVRSYAKASKDAGKGNLYSLPSKWWQSAVDLPEPWPEDVKFAFTQLTVQRNEMITGFLLHSVMSVLRDLSHGSPGMDPITDFMKRDAPMASAMVSTLTSIRNKPLIRCQNCTKTPEEIGGNAKFMVCSSCKSKLNFVVHYCSQACQKEDWRNHKKHCGKKKVAKILKGTAQDRFWEFPNLPDAMRSTIPDSKNGHALIRDLGFGTPHPSHPHSPALQRQLSLLTGDRDADYFLFDEMERPIRFIVYDTWVKMNFRLTRANAMFGAEPSTTVEALAEYLIKIMGNRPGLSRARILAQFSKEYGIADMVEKVEAFERMGVENGYEPGVTFMETISKNMPRMFKLMSS